MLHEVNWYTIAMTLRNFLRNYKKSDGSILFPSLVDRDDLIIRVGAVNAYSNNIVVCFRRLNSLFHQQTPKIITTSFQGLIYQYTTRSLPIIIRCVMNNLNNNTSIIKWRNRRTFVSSIVLFSYFL